MLKEMNKTEMKAVKVWRLNPYFNGTCSKRQRDIANGVLFKVVILILMEHAQRVRKSIIILLAQREHFL